MLNWSNRKNIPGAIVLSMRPCIFSCQCLTWVLMVAYHNFQGLFYLSKVKWRQKVSWLVDHLGNDQWDRWTNRWMDRRMEGRMDRQPENMMPSVPKDDKYLFYMMSKDFFLLHDCTLLVVYMVDKYGRQMSFSLIPPATVIQEAPKCLLPMTVKHGEL